MKEIDGIAQGIADMTIEVMEDSIHWQIASQLAVGENYNAFHKEVMTLAIGKMYWLTRGF